MWPSARLVKSLLVGNWRFNDCDQRYGVAGSNVVPMIKIGACVVEVTGAGGVAECANQLLHGALPHDMARAMSGTAVR